MKDLKTLGTMFKQLNYILNKKQKKSAIGIIIIIFLSAIFELLGVSVLLPFMQVLLTPQEMMENEIIAFFIELFNLNFAEVAFLLCIGIILIYIIKNLFLLLSSYLQILYRTHLLQDLSVLMLKSYMNRPYAFFVSTNSGKIMRGITSDVAGVHDIIQNSFKLLTELMVMLLIGIYLLYTDLVLAVGVLLIGGITLIIIVFGYKKRMTAMGMLGRQATAENNKCALQIVDGIKEIFIKQRKKEFLELYKNSYDNRTKASISYGFASSCPERIIETVSVMTIIGMVAFRLFQGVDMSLFIAKLAVFAVAFFRLMPSISRAVGYINAIVYNRPNLNAAYENILDARQNNLFSISIDNDEAEMESVCISYKESISIQNISWRYDGREKNVLDNLSLIINKNEAIGIMGESGAGKSTLIDILLGLYKPLTGDICLDKQSIFDNVNTWSKIIGYVPQNVFLLDDTIRNNILFGKESCGDEKIWEVLELASLKEFVSALPNKLDTVLGERGIKFSGGQRQRIAIARALYDNPDVLILDEATSALDNETETAVMEAIESLQGQKTLIIVAHRLSTIRNCDKIYEIKEGKALLRDTRTLFED